MSTKRKFVINFFSCYRNCLLKEKRITLSLGYFIYLNMKNSNYGKSNIHIKTFILFTPYVEHFEFCFFFQSWLTQVCFVFKWDFINFFPHHTKLLFYKNHNNCCWPNALGLIDVFKMWNLFIKIAFVISFLLI